MYILLELCRNKSMVDLMKGRDFMTEVEVRFYLVQLGRAIDYIHHHRILHRDIKLGNVFLGDGLVPKLGDFGLSI